MAEIPCDSRCSRAYVWPGQIAFGIPRLHVALDKIFWARRFNGRQEPRVLCRKGIPRSISGLRVSKELAGLIRDSGIEHARASRSDAFKTLLRLATNRHRRWSRCGGERRLKYRRG